MDLGFSNLARVLLADDIVYRRQDLGAVPVSPLIGYRAVPCSFSGGELEVFDITSHASARCHRTGLVTFLCPRLLRAWTVTSLYVDILFG